MQLNSENLTNKIKIKLPDQLASFSKQNIKPRDKFVNIFIYSRRFLEHSGISSSQSNLKFFSI